MANDKDKDAGQKAGETSAAKGSKGAIKLLLGVVLMIASGGGIALMALPKKDKGPEAFNGPWSIAFFDKETVANTLDDNYSRYFAFSPSCSYFGYDQLYPEKRKTDPDYLPRMQETMSDVVSRFRLNDIMKDGVGEELALTAQLEEYIEPIVFPVHIGGTVLPLVVDEESGLRAGDSHTRRSTFRGPFREHALQVDAKKGTVQLDDGDVVEFKGRETDLEVRGSDGRSVYLDVTHLKPNFVGKVHVGVHGRIRQIFLGSKRAQ